MVRTCNKNRTRSIWDDMTPPYLPPLPSSMCTSGTSCARSSETRLLESRVDTIENDVYRLQRWKTNCDNDLPFKVAGAVLVTCIAVVALILAII